MLTLGIPIDVHRRSRPVFVVGALSIERLPHRIPRLLRIPPRPELGDNISRLSYASAREQSWQWVDAYLLQSSVKETIKAPMYKIPINLSLLSPFRFPESHIGRFISSATGVGRRLYELCGVHSVSVPWTGRPAATFMFRLMDRNDDEQLTRREDLYALIQVGTCPRPEFTVKHLWARARAWHSLGHVGRRTIMDLPHLCQADHLVKWPERKKCFFIGPFAPPAHDEWWHVVLSFSPSPVQPTRIVDLEACLATTPQCSVCGVTWDPCRPSPELRYALHLRSRCHV